MPTNVGSLLDELKAHVNFLSQSVPTATVTLLMDLAVSQSLISRAVDLLLLPHAQHHDIEQAMKHLLDSCQQYENSQPK